MNDDETNLHETNLYDEDGVLRAILVEPPNVIATKRLSIDMPVALHRRFKSVCAAAGLIMVEQVLVAIEERAAELERKHMK
jgi:hypothetical protein